MNKHMMIEHENNISTHFGVFCIITRSLLKYTDLNITEFLTKIIVFLEDCASKGLSQTYLKKKKFIKHKNTL